VIVANNNLPSYFPMQIFGLCSKLSAVGTRENVWSFKFDPYHAQFFKISGVFPRTDCFNDATLTLPRKGRTISRERQTQWSSISSTKHWTKAARRWS